MSSTNHTRPENPSWLTEGGSTAWMGTPEPPPSPAASPVAATPRAAAAEEQPAGEPSARSRVDSEAPVVEPARSPAPLQAGAPAMARLSPSDDPGRAVSIAHPGWEDGEGVLSNVVRYRSSRPKEGWRALVYRATGGRWNPGLSAAEERLSEQLAGIRTPLHGPHSVVVGSIKGGIGKTTVCSLLGLALAEYRGDRVIAVDANPDAGTLGDRLVGEKLASTSTVRDLLDDMHTINSSTDLSRYTHLARRLQVLTSEQEPELSEMFSDRDYECVLRLLSRFFEAILTDSGTGVVHSAMQGSLTHADSLVIVGAPTQDGASRASRTLQWLATHGYRQLAEDAVVVLSCDRHSPFVDETVIREHFESRCRAVVELPPDPHLATGGIIDLDALSPPARDAALDLAATVAQGFHAPRSRGLAHHGFRTEPSH